MSIYEASHPFVLRLPPVNTPGNYILGWLWKNTWHIALPSPLQVGRQRHPSLKAVRVPHRMDSDPAFRGHWVSGEPPNEGSFHQRIHSVESAETTLAEVIFETETVGPDRTQLSIRWQPAFESAMVLSAYKKAGIFDQMADLWPETRTGFKGLYEAIRDTQIAAMWQTGKQSPQIAKEMGLTPKAIFKRIEVLRQKYGPAVIPHHLPRRNYPKPTKSPG